ncbi:MAG: DNA polymerase I [Chloroflexi bacterium]|nr:DNA polymerase I [Chloroflexota bacterium]
MTDDVRLMLIDGHALIHRAYHALPELSTSEGEIINAVFGFASMLLKAIETLEPTHIILTLDRPVPTFRHEAFAEYKATRPKAPPPLVAQFARVRQVAEAFNIPIYERDGYEADDLLGTLSSQADRAGLATTIVTGDLDTLQLVTDRVHVLTARRGIADTTIYDLPAVRRRYGLDPSQLPDLKGLVGDTSDNIPGVQGIGEKTASRLLADHGTLENLFQHLEEVPRRTREALEANREQVFRSRQLARIDCAAPVTLDLEKSAFKDVDRTRVLEIFRALEFRTLIERWQAMFPRDSQAAPTGASAAGERVEQLSIFGGDEAAAAGPPAAVPAGAPQTSVLPAPSTKTRTVRTRDDLDALLSDLRSAGTFAVDTETTSTDPLRARLVGLSFATCPEQAWYVPVGHAEGEQLPIDEVLAALHPLLEGEDSRKIGHNVKYDIAVLESYDIYLQGLYFDTMIAAYLVNPSPRALSLSALAMSRLGVEMTPIETLIGKGKGQITMDLVDVESVASYAGADAGVTFQLKTLLEKELADLELESLFHTVEMPLVAVLAAMERTGVALDTRVLAEMSREMTEALGNLEARIYEAAGHRFNINSTQQLGQVLFQQLKLPAGRRTKTGHSTDNEVLEGLRGRHPIVDDILEYRQLIKLKNTYVDALPSLINPDTGRVHTDFNQTVAATGRLSSSNPNLQNIPVRGELGRRIRRAFVPARPENVLLAADYSQIELRILASMSGDERLLEAFRSGQDIHRATAAAVFGVPLEAVTADQRRIAKVVNFGIIYGIGEGRLAYETGISRAEARDFIASYNATYAGVTGFMDKLRRRAALYRYVTTLLNRRRPIPDITSEHPGLRAAAERAAINMPIQGTAADIIKIAMIGLHQQLLERFPDAHMVLQVHDELVFDVPAAQVDEIAPLVRDTMVGALDLSVPLEVEMKIGRDWYDMSPLEIQRGGVPAANA